MQEQGWNGIDIFFEMCKIKSEPENFLGRGGRNKMAEALKEEEIKIGTEIEKTGKEAEDKNSSLARIGVSLPSNLLDKFDKIIRGRRYSSRSEGIRDAIRGYIIEYEWMERESGEEIAVITYTYDHNRKRLRSKLEKIESSFRNIIEESSRVLAGNGIDLVIVAVKGETKQIKELTERIMSQKGVESVKLTTH